METKYPRVVTLDNPELKGLLQKKNDMVLKGREISLEIEDKEKEMDAIDTQIKEVEAKVDIKEFEDQAKEVTDKMNALLLEMKEVEKAIYAKITANVPEEFKNQYDKKLEEKAGLENDRNKVALKIQKLKDLIIPMTQKIAKPYLTEEFEDFNDIRLENGEIVLEIFSHLEDFKNRKRQVANK